ncbi:MAG: hypothetical protein KJ043_14320 [Anaerolineae bacterium]|nr:hypothetical protein [Anaerolineae bacterium]
MRYRIMLYMSFIAIGFVLFISQQPVRAADQVVTDCVNFTGPTDDTLITLDEAVNNAIATGGGTVTFACPAGTVIVTNFEMNIAINTVTIDGGGNVTIDANNSHRIAYINGGATLNLQNITIRNGLSVFGGALYNDGTLSLSNVIAQNSNASSQGGAIYNATGRPVTITNSTFSNNTSASGGAIYTLGTANISTTTFTGSTCATSGAGAINNGGGNVRDGASTGCPGSVVLSVNVFCVADELRIVVNAGDPDFSLNSSTLGNLGTLVIGAVTLTGPNDWGTITITELSGNGEVFTANNVICPVPVALSASAVCNGASLEVNITAGDTPLELTDDSGTLQTGFSTGLLALTGPLSVTNLTLTELGGDGESLNLGNFTCHNVLSASAVCIGADLHVTISAGDANFQITADSGTLLTGLGIGTHTITGPVNETNVNVTELGGNTENFALGNFNCFASSTLTASAVCVGADLQITISNGNAPFSISVTDSVGTMNSGGNPLGVYTFTGPDTFTNIGITEDTGDLEVLNLPDVTCTAPIIPVVPVAPVVLSPDLTALGCVLTQDVFAPTTPDNTYCRVLMKNGAVINYAGAVPQNLIDLGVIFAVDVYRLQGGQSITEFPNYTRVCLAGQGRLFYLDARISPRALSELTTETDGAFTCGWIPAAGTLVLTN